MSTFPTLTKGPVAVEFEETAAFNPVIRASFESGHTLTRARTTRVPKKWIIVYSGLTQTDKDTLRAFEVSMNYGADSFTWENPQTGVEGDNYTVRFVAPIVYKIMEDPQLPNGSPEFWRAEFELEEV